MIKTKTPALNDWHHYRSEIQCVRNGAKRRGNFQVITCYTMIPLYQLMKGNSVISLTTLGLITVHW